MKTKNLVLCAVCAAITCVLAPLSIPISGMIPITLATFAVMLSGILLGGRLGALSQVIYLIIGAVGVPVCAGFTPALPKLLGPTGGYLVGYIPLAFVCGAIYSMWGKKSRGVKKYAFMLLGMIAGTVVLYAFRVVLHFEPCRCHLRADPVRRTVPDRRRDQDRRRDDPRASA